MEHDEQTIDVRRNLRLTASVGLAASLLAVAFVLRAADGGALVDWIFFGVLTVIGLVHLAAAVDSRAPLLVADGQGVRLREGNVWQGVSWRDVECLEHLPRRGMRDGHLLLLAHDHQQLVVPLTVATRVGGTSIDDLSDDLAAMADGRADVVEVVPGVDDDDDLGDGAAETTTEVARVPDPEPVTEEVAEPASTTDGAVPLADHGRRGGLVSTLLHRALPLSPPTVGANALHADPVTETLPEVEDELRPEADHDEDGWDSFGVRVFGKATPVTEETATVVLGEVPVQPAENPVIGRELRTARERIRLSIDQLAERTRIRPHVLESMEADDFSACGGDFYARGHLRTLGRVLGLESGPLLATYDEKYADAPVDPKRVFESELATGVGGSIRGTRGGRNWSVLVAGVMAAVLIWSIAHLLMDGPVPVGDAPVLNQSGGIANGAANQAEAVPVTLTAVGGGAKLVVRDGGGDIVFDGRLAFGQSTRLDVAPPVRISSSDGSVTASLDGGDAAALGTTGEDVTKTLVP